MDVAQHLLVLLHLVAFAALLGGALVQLRTPDPEISTAMLHGAWVSLVCGVALWVLAGVAGDRVLLWVEVVTTLLATVVALLVVLNRRFFSIPRGLLRLIVVLVVAETAIGVFFA